MGGLLRQKRGREGSLLAGPVVVEPAVWANFVPLVEACSAGWPPHMRFWFAAWVSWRLTHSRWKVPPRKWMQSSRSWDMKHVPAMDVQMHSISDCCAPACAHVALYGHNRFFVR